MPDLSPQLRQSDFNVKKVIIFVILFRFEFQKYTVLIILHIVFNEPNSIKECVKGKHTFKTICMFGSKVLQ